MAIPVLSIAQMRQWEQATWRAGRTQADVISRVGHLVAHRARQLTRAGDIVLVLAGKGHNGDDARQAVPHLSDREINALDVADPAAGLREFDALLPLAPALIIDGLFGIGLTRALSRHWIGLLSRINQTRIPVLSIDVPSGLDADTGEARGAALQAAITLTLGAPKAGLLAPAAAAFVGRLEVAADIGLVASPCRGSLWWTLPLDFAAYPPGRPAESHKGSFGHAALVAGSLGCHGAAVLMARAALCARPGLVTLFTQDPVFTAVASQLQAAMVHPMPARLELPESSTALAFGPGLAAPTIPQTLKDQLAAWWRALPLPVLADASALDWLPRGRTRSRGVRVVTPHPGEAGRLLGVSARNVQADRPAALRAVSKQLGGAWVVLKGRHTLVGRATGPLYANCSGDPGLAQGGTGDLLAGLLAGLLAQPQLQGDPLTLLRYGVWRHGAAADRLTAQGVSWTVEALAAGL